MRGNDYVRQMPFLKDDTKAFVAKQINTFIDILMMSGMLILGITLIFGFASKLTTIATCAFMLVMYSLHVPPTDNPVVDYHLMLIGLMIAVYLLGGFDRISVQKKWKECFLVKRFPILE